MLKTGSNARDRSGTVNSNPNPKTSAAIEPNSKASSKIPFPISGSKKRLDSTSTSALLSKEAHVNDKATPGAFNLLAFVCSSFSVQSLVVDLLTRNFLILGAIFPWENV